MFEPSAFVAEDNLFEDIFLDLEGKSLLLVNVLDLFFETVLRNFILPERIHFLGNHSIETSLLSEDCVPSIPMWSSRYPTDTPSKLIVCFPFFFSFEKTKQFLPTGLNSALNRVFLHQKLHFFGFYTRIFKIIGEKIKIFFKLKQYVNGGI